MRRTSLTICTVLGIWSALTSESPCAEEKITLSEEHLRAVDRERRTIINYEGRFIGAPFLCDGVELDELVEWHFSFLDRGNHSIDSVWWCFGGGNWASWPSEVLPVYRFRKYKEWHEKGVDIVRRYVEETRKRGLEVFISHRMNSADTGTKRQPRIAPPGCKIELSGKIEAPPMKQAHPEWLIRAWKEPNNPAGYVYCWDYSQQGVRDYRLGIYRELAENYDIDGIELDFCRSPPVLPLGRQWENRDKLTDFVRSVRLMLLEVEKKRGRPLLLACRVPDSLLGARMDGFDLERWARELLVDIFIPGSRSVEYDLAGFQRITRGTPIKVYPCLEGHHTSDGYKNPPIEVLRGEAASWWSQGVEGIQTMNFRNITKEASRPFKERQLLLSKYDLNAAWWDDQHQLYSEIGSPKTLMYKDKTFIVQRRGGGGVPAHIWPNPDDWYTPTWFYCNTNMFAPLPAAISKKGSADTLLPLYVGDDVNALADRIRSITLHVLVSNATEEQMARIQARANGVQLERPAVEKGWLTFKIEPNQLAPGENIFGLRTGKNLPQDAKEIRIEKLEVRVQYRR